MKRKVWLILLSFFLLNSEALASVPNDILKEIDSLASTIDSYPPKFQSDTERSQIEKNYLGVKAKLDAALGKTPNDTDLLFQRGRLQLMGHNMDLPKAWEGAESDFLSILNMNPNHQDAMVELGRLYVNSDPSLAPKAEELFVSAQRVHGSQPLESAQAGLFFARYYQGKMKDALSQAEFLSKTWPNTNYSTLVNTVKSVLDRKNGKK